MMLIRLYTQSDYFKLIELLRLNIPQYFARSEEQDFIDYLHRYALTYYIVEMDGEMVGGGGINYFFESHSARISWDFIHPEYHGQGIGKSMTEYRIEKIKSNSSIQSIVVRTSQLAFRFYEKIGFKVDRVVKDFWAEGFDLYEMKMLFKH